MTDTISPRSKPDRQGGSISRPIKSITESELSLIMRSDAAYQMNINQSVRGGFGITVNLGSEHEPLHLLTFRKKPREWVSLDRLTRHLREKYGAVPTIRLTLFPGDRSDESNRPWDAARWRA